MSVRRLAVGALLLAAVPARASDGGGPLATDAAPPRDPTRREAEAALELARTGRWAEAVPLFRAALAKNPTSAAVTTDLGYSLGRVGQRGEAEQLLKRAIELDPTRPYAYQNLAELIATDPARFARRDEVLAVLERGLPRVATPEGQASLTLAMAELDRSVGLLGNARKRLEPIAANAPTVKLRARALALLDALAAEERGRSLEDWPTPTPTVDERQALASARRSLDDGDPVAARRLLEPVRKRRPSLVEARWLLTRALESEGRHDEAIAELGVVLELRPSDARAWRELGTLLADHGGTLEAARADEALRRALALEPSWRDLHEKRKLVRRRLAAGAAPAGNPAPLPSPRARELVEQARHWIAEDAPEMAETLLQAALADSPTDVEAAVMSFSVTGRVPQATVRALWSSREGLYALARGVGAIARGPVRTEVASWLDRAVELGSVEARYDRAVARADAGDRAGALDDLSAYVAGPLGAVHLDEARALRRTLLQKSDVERAAPAVTQDLTIVRQRLVEGRPAEALSAVGACAPGRPPSKLLAAGWVHEYLEETPAALRCYELAVAGADASDQASTGRALSRLGTAAAGADVAELAPRRALLSRAARSGVAPAHIALARLHEASGDPSTATGHFEAFLKVAAPDDPARDEVRARLAAVADAEGRARSERLGLFRSLAGAFVVLLGGLGVLLVRRRLGRTVAAAVVRTPALYPTLARVIAELRHDVLKHRTSALSLFGTGDSDAEVVRALREPKPCSEAVAALYGQLAQAAAACGERVRPLAREPVFGPLWADLRRAEALVVDPRRRQADVGAIAHRLAHEHADGLARLVSLCPKTRLAAPTLAGWVRAVEAELRSSSPSLAWTSPGLALDALEIELPVDEAAARGIFSNLLRNAAAAVAPQGSQAHVVVQVRQGRDALGRRTVGLAVADSAPASPSLQDIESRDGTRGLGLVRDTVRAWGGRVVIEPRNQPLAKAIEVVFPAREVAAA